LGIASSLFAQSFAAPRNDVKKQTPRSEAEYWAGLKKCNPPTELGIASSLFAQSFAAPRNDVKKQAPRSEAEY